VVRMGEEKKKYRPTSFRWESPKERDKWKDQGVDGRMGSECVLGRLAGGCGLDSVGSG
jgi:hypothetical protein